MGCEHHSNPAHIQQQQSLQAAGLRCNKADWMPLLSR
jgi:hypothetical protein